MSRDSGGNALFLKILAGIFAVAALGVGLYLALRPASPQVEAGAPPGTPQSVKATPTGVQQMKPGARGRRH